MGAKELRFRDDARDKIARGVAVFADTVQVTLGPRGRLVALERAGAAPLLTKDGTTVATALSLSDRFENLGAQVVRDAALRTAEQAGDGSTTAIVLARAMIREGMKFLAVGVDAMSIRRGMETAVQAACAELDRLARPCAGDDMVRQVAAVAANGDAEVGRLIASALGKVGARGVVAVEDGDSVQDSLEIRSGFQFDRGWLSPHLCTDRGDSVVLEGASVLLHEEKISTLEDVLPTLEAAAGERSPLLVIAGDVEGAALATLIANARRGGPGVCAVKAPGIGDERKALLRDLAVLTGATVLAPDTGTGAASVTARELGRARHIEVNRSTTVIIDGAGSPASIASRVKELEAELTESRSGHEADVLRMRVAALAGSAAIIKIGACTEVELRGKKERIDDALRAARAALEEGVVPGGGVALLRAMQALRAMHAPTESQQAGVEIVLRALDEPLRRIAANSGAEPLVVSAKVAAGGGDFGYDAASGCYRDLCAAGVLDAKKVSRVALQNAASVAALMLTTDCMIAEYDVAAPEPPFDDA